MSLLLPVVIGVSPKLSLGAYAGTSIHGKLSGRYLHCVLTLEGHRYRDSPPPGHAGQGIAHAGVRQVTAGIEPAPPGTIKILYALPGGPEWCVLSGKYITAPVIL